MSRARSNEARINRARDHDAGGSHATSDQAQQLRDIMHLKKNGGSYEQFLTGLSDELRDSLVQTETTEIEQPLDKQESPPDMQTIAITSGKGGVGKTTVSANLAISLTRQGRKVILLDADLGMANLDLVLGMNPSKTLYHVISGQHSIEEVIEEGPLGVKVVAGGSGLSELADLSTMSRNRLLKSLERLNVLGDTLIIDTGAGISTNVLSFIESADQVVILMTPEPPAIADAYGVLKSVSRASHRGIILPVANRVNSFEQGRELLRRFRGAAERFLNLELHPGSSIVEDGSVKESILARSPLMLLRPDSMAAGNIGTLGQLLFPQEEEQKIKPENQGLTSFIRKLSSRLLNRNKHI